MKKMKRVIPAVLFSLSGICLALGILFFLWDHPDIISKEDNTAKVVSLEEEISEPETIPSQIPEIIPEDTVSEEPAAEEDVSANAPEEEEPVEVRVDNPYKEYFLKNSDMVGWLKIPDTILDYPVMWTPEDENYYLRKNFDEKYDVAGTPLLDTDSSMYPLSTNLIIHGHNIKGVMFADTLLYATKEYRDEHPYIYLYGKDYEHIYEVMAVFRSQVFYTTDTCFKYYKFFQADTAEEFNDFYDNVKAMSLYDTGVTAEFGDRFITLSTCSDHVENGRFVVVGKEIEPGASYFPLEEDVSDNVTD